MAKEQGSQQWRRFYQAPCTTTVMQPVAPLTVPSKGRIWSACVHSSSLVHLQHSSDSPHSLASSNPQYSLEITTGGVSAPLIRDVLHF